MELIYLWVEKYKNIEKQGFYFSPKFRCEYNPDTNELKIEENENYVNLFPDNINITAIVGKNGSGKSNLVKCLFELISLYFFKNEMKEYYESNPKARDFFIDLIKNNKMFLIIKQNNNFYKIDSEYLKQNSVSKKFEEIRINNLQNFIKSLDNFFIYYNFSLDDWSDSLANEFYHKQDNYETPILLEPDKKNGFIDLNLLKNLTNQRILLFYSFLKDKLINNEITSFFNPDRIKFYFARSIKNDKVIYDLEHQIDGLFNDKDNVAVSKFGPILENINTNYFKLIEKYINYFEQIAIKENINFAISTEHLNKMAEILKLYENNDYENINLLYLFFKIIEKKESIKKYKEFENLSIESLENEFKNISSINNFLNVNNFEEFKKKIANINVDNIKNIYEIKKIIVAIQFHKNEHFNKLKDYINQEIPLQKIPPKNILEYFPAWLNVEFYDGEKSLSSLSSGEKFKFQFLIGLLYQLYNLNSKNEYSTINIFLDEIELGFHPEWQRIYIDDILFTLNKFKEITNFNKKINLFFLTHSPFIISDLPKENIIFLDRDENGKCKVVNGLNEKKETFGANIHTLLSDSFFMKDGFMGKFAESKIDEVIKYLNNEKSEIKTDEEAQRIINIIGEPIIKKELQGMLDSKRLNKINRLENEIELLKYRFEILRQNS